MIWLYAARGVRRARAAPVGDCGAALATGVPRVGAVRLVMKVENLVVP
jgi:hypothetical protein